MLVSTCLINPSIVNWLDQFFYLNRKLLEEREKIFKLQSEYMLLQNQIERIQADELTSLKTTFDLGCNCYCQAKMYAELFYNFINIFQDFVENWV